MYVACILHFACLTEHTNQSDSGTNFKFGNWDGDINNYNPEDTDPATSLYSNGCLTLGF